jgi:hypothetical protein
MFHHQPSLIRITPLFQTQLNQLENRGLSISSIFILRLVASLGIGFCWQKFGVDFDFPKSSMWSRVDGVLGIPEKCPSHQ